MKAKRNQQVCSAKDLIYIENEMIEMLESEYRPVEKVHPFTVDLQELAETIGDGARLRWNADSTAEEVLKEAIGKPR